MRSHYNRKRRAALQILFGPENAGRHISPDERRRYEWRYFDALSDDGRFALVVIFFLGSPMSPYYGRAVSGGKVLPKDYWGVSVTLHENAGEQWRERAYAYNLYHTGEFAADGACIRIGESAMARTAAGWRLTLSERGLWRGAVTAEVAFAPVGMTPDLPPQGANDGHTWLCIAPHCRVRAKIITAKGAKIAFRGLGYHDGNFGSLPWPEGTRWYWGRILKKPLTGGEGEALVYYHLEQENGAEGETTLITRGGAGVWRAEAATCEPSEIFLNRGAILIAPQWKNLTFYGATVRRTVETLTDGGSLLKGPFYNRWPIRALFGGDYRPGIGEVFRPNYLTRPLWRIMLNTRLRRR